MRPASHVAHKGEKTDDYVFQWENCGEEYIVLKSTIVYVKR
jgi:hypothetical protein